MQAPHFSRNQAGFSLVQVVVAMGLIAVVSLGGAMIAEQMGRVGRYVQSQVGRSALHHVLQKVLSNDQLCDSFLVQGISFQAPTPSSSGVTSLGFNLRDSGTSNSTVVTNGATLEKFDVRIAPGGFTLNIPAGTSAVASGADQLWTGYVDLKLERTGAAAGGQTLATHTLGALTVRVNGAGNIIGCEGYVASASQTCVELGGTWTGTQCNFPSVFPCPAGTIMTGPNPPTDCSSCPANQVLVFNGSGGFTCQAYP